MSPGLRMMVVWCPDWPVVSWGMPADEPAAVIVANRVVATSRAARLDGVAEGQRRREAQSRCPELALLERDTDREVRLFEPIAAALDAITPRVEVAGPGLVGFPTRGPSRFFGGDAALAEHVLAVVAPVVPRRAVVRVAVADGVFAARLAARSLGPGAYTPEGTAPRETIEAGSGVTGERSIRIVDEGESPAFLAPLPIGALAMSALTDVLARLGIETLGLLAKLDPADVIGRFGREGQLGQRLARGEDSYPPDLRKPAPDLAVTWTFEPPAELVERCAYAVKVMADEFHETLSSRGLACVRVGIEAETETGEVQKRLWRDQGALSAAAVAERTRWQLDGWLQQSVRPSSGILRVTLIPDEVIAATGRQLQIWGGGSADAEKVTRAVARIQALMGADSVLVPEYRGGVSPGEQIAMVPAAAVDLAEERPATQQQWIQEPWPGQIPKPSPAQVYVDPLPVEVLDEQSRIISVNGRGELSSQPVALARSGTTRRSKQFDRIIGWAGPWPAEQRWWDPLTCRRLARLQVVLEDQSAYLLALEDQAWHLEASYR